MIIRRQFLKGAHLISLDLDDNKFLSSTFTFSSSQDSLLLPFSLSECNQHSFRPLSWFSQLMVGPDQSELLMVCPDQPELLMAGPDQSEELMARPD